VTCARTVSGVGGTGGGGEAVVKSSSKLSMVKLS
jgi:hypothetical protein